MEHRSWLILAGIAVVYLGLLFASPIRSSFVDGMRCVRRYSTLWGVLALFGFCYAAFQLGLRIFFHFVLPDEMRPIFQWSRAWFLPESDATQILWQSILPAAENVAGIFNNLLTTYPFSAVAAILLLVNWQDHLRTLRKALLRRSGTGGIAIYLGICISALAAIAKPFMYVFLPLISTERIQVDPLLALQISTIIDWLSFLFEYLFGVCIQLYLILLVYAWLRGLSFTHQHMLDFAIRRFGFVVRWAAVVMAVSSVFINLPLILSNFPGFAQWITPEGVVRFIDRAVRPALAIFLLLFSTVQIILTFHSESLKKALHDHLHFVSRNWLPMVWFALLAGLPFYLLNALNAFLVRGMGEGTTLIVAWQLLFPLGVAFVAGWLLASWVCLFKRCESGRIDVDNWIQF